MRQRCLSTGEFVKACLKKRKNQDYGVINFAGTLILSVAFPDLLKDWVFYLKLNVSGLCIAVASFKKDISI